MGVKLRTTPGRSRNMAAIRSRGNESTELRVVRMLRDERIVGWRRHLPIPGRPDFTWPKARVTLFVDGCFWHGCPKCYRLPGRNQGYWRLKFLRNQERDRAVTRKLRDDGWRVIRVWECSLAAQATRDRIRLALEGKTSRHSPRSDAPLSRT